MRPVRMPLSLARVYDAHADALFGFLLNLTRLEADARDALQEVFVKLARRPELLEGVRDERAFLLRLAHHAALDLFRRKETRARYETRFAEETPLFTETAPGEESAFREQVAAALAEVPEEQRAVVHLKLWEGLPFDAIAGVLGFSPNTAASRYRYAL